MRSVLLDSALPPRRRDRRRAILLAAICAAAVAPAPLRAQSADSLTLPDSLAAMVRGTVTSEDGTPLPGAQVEAGVARTVADRDGAFELRVPAAPPTLLSFGYPGHLDGQVALELTPGLTVELAVRLVRVVVAGDTTRPGLIRGVVRDPELRPLPNAVVTLAGAERTTTARGDGSFELREVPPGAYLLTTRLLGYGPMSHSLTVRSEPVTVEPVLFPLSRTLAADTVVAPRGGRRLEMVLEELDTRLQVRPRVNSAVVTREQLAKLDRMTLDLALYYSSASHLMETAMFRSAVPTSFVPRESLFDGAVEGNVCILENGTRPRYAILREYGADQIEMLEVYRPNADLSGTLAPRLAMIPQCRGEGPVRHPTIYVVWLRGGM